MGKLAIISDLHVDINQLAEPELSQLVEVLQKKKVTHLHLAGDTANNVTRLRATVALIEQAGIPVTYNFGNHEMPSLVDAEAIEHYQDQHFLNHHFIELNSQLVLLAFNGWYDYSFSLEPDYQKVVAAKNLYWYDRLIERAEDDPSTLKQILNQLEAVLNQLERRGKKVIIATHFVPRKEFIVYQNGKYQRWNQLNAFLGSVQTGKLFDQYEHIQHVVFGHTHRQFKDREINGTLYSCRPFGYYYEWSLTREFVLNRDLMTQFNPLKARGIIKEHQAEFLAVREANLKNEFSRSLTMIDY